MKESFSINLQHLYYYQSVYKTRNYEIQYLLLRPEVSMQLAATATHFYATFTHQ